MPRATTPAVAKAYASLAVAESVSGQLAQAKSALQRAEAYLERITVESVPVAKPEDTAIDEHMVAIKPEDGGESEGSSESELPSVAKNKKGKIPGKVDDIDLPMDNYTGNGRRSNQGHSDSQLGKTTEGSSYELFTLAQKEEIIAMCKVVKQFLEREKGNCVWSAVCLV
jgi:hypothetical protein